jgi:hypothetical protein
MHTIAIRARAGVARKDIDAKADAAIAVIAPAQVDVSR